MTFPKDAEFLQCFTELSFPLTLIREGEDRLCFQLFVLIAVWIVSGRGAEETGGTGG